MADKRGNLRAQLCTGVIIGMCRKRMGGILSLCVPLTLRGNSNLLQRKHTLLSIGHLLPERFLSMRLQLTRTTQSSLTNNGSDFHTLLTMQFANRGESYSSWYNFVPTHTWTLSNGDGLKTVLGQVRDMSGNISEPFSDTIILDTTPPTCSVLINNGAAYTNSTPATLALGSTDTERC